MKLSHLTYIIYGTSDSFALSGIMTQAYTMILLDRWNTNQITYVLGAKRDLLMTNKQG